MRPGRTVLQKPALGSVLGSSSLAQGLQICLLLNEGAGQQPRDLLGRAQGTVTGSLVSTWKTVNRGIGFKQTSNGPYVDFGPVSQFKLTTQVTIATLAPWDRAVVGTGQNSTRLFLAYHGFSPTVGITNGDAGASPGFVGWQFSLATAGNANLVVTGAPSQGTGSHLSYADLAVGTYDGAHAKVYVNGVLSNSTADGTGFSPTQTDHLTFTDWAANTQSFQQPILFAALWNRALLPAEIQDLYLGLGWALTSPGYRRIA